MTAIIILVFPFPFSPVYTVNEKKTFIEIVKKSMDQCIQCRSRDEIRNAVKNIRPPKLTEILEK